MLPPSLADWIGQQMGQPLRQVRQVGGGCIHHAWRLELADGSLVFAKTNRASRLALLEAEAEGLNALAAAAKASPVQNTPLLIPQPLQLAEVDDAAILLLPWLPLQSRAANAAGHAWRQLGAGLARLHRASLAGHDGRFGWRQANFIGTAPQANAWSHDWGMFFQQQRLAPQLRWAQQQGQSLAGADALLAAVPRWLAHHKPDACLVHGDLWSGNAALLEGGGASLFDPAVHRGDREVDLAMARLFGGFPQAFFDGYEQEWPLPDDHRPRIDLYNLYHLLNHANLFGGSYWHDTARSIQALLHHWNGAQP